SRGNVDAHVRHRNQPTRAPHPRHMKSSALRSGRDFTNRHPRRIIEAMFELATRSPAASLWFEGGMPTRLVWQGRRWRVTDTPTALADLVAGVTHPPALEGWR